MTPRTLWPREHGAYAQLGIPLLAAFAIGVSLPSILIAVAACAAFLANEPLLVILGHRGKRIRDHLGARARSRVVLLAMIAFGAGTLGIVSAPMPAVAVAGVAALAGLGIAATGMSGRAHTLGGELVAAIALPGAAAPVAVAAGVSWANAAAMWAAWTIGYAGCVFAIHRVITPRRRRPWLIAGGLPLIIGSLAIAGIGLTISMPIVSMCLPLVAVATWTAMRPPRATQVRAVGVMFVSASIVALVIAVALA